MMEQNEKNEKYSISMHNGKRKWIECTGFITFTILPFTMIENVRVACMAAMEREKKLFIFSSLHAYVILVSSRWKRWYVNVYTRYTQSLPFIHFITYTTGKRVSSVSLTQTHIPIARTSASFFPSLFLVPSNRIQFNDSIEYTLHTNTRQQLYLENNRQKDPDSDSHTIAQSEYTSLLQMSCDRIEFVSFFVCFFSEERKYCQVECGKDAWYMDAYFLSLILILSVSVSEDTASTWSRFDRDSSLGTHDSATWVFVVFDLISLYQTSDDT